jgi:hypothetical protein
LYLILLAVVATVVLLGVVVGGVIALRGRNVYTTFGVGGLVAAVVLPAAVWAVHLYARMHQVQSMERAGAEAGEVAFAIGLGVVLGGGAALCGAVALGLGALARRRGVA